MQIIRHYAVEHKDWLAEVEKLHGKPVKDPKPEEGDVSSLVCTRCHSLRMEGNKVVLEVIYEEPPPLVVLVPPPA